MLSGITPGRIPVTHGNNSQAVDGKREERVIRMTRECGAADRVSYACPGRELGELGGPERVRLTPDPAAGHPDSHNRTVRSRVVTIAWPTPLHATRNAVYSVTVPAGD